MVIRGLLYRVDDEVLVGLQGQPDLGWDAFNLWEARAPSPEVVARARPAPPSVAEVGGVPQTGPGQRS